MAHSSGLTSSGSDLRLLKYLRIGSIYPQHVSCTAHQNSCSASTTVHPTAGATLPAATSSTERLGRDPTAEGRILQHPEHSAGIPTALTWPRLGWKEVLVTPEDASSWGPMLSPLSGHARCSSEEVLLFISFSHVGGRQVCYCWDFFLFTFFFFSFCSTEKPRSARKQIFSLQSQATDFSEISGLHLSLLLWFFPLYPFFSGGNPWETIIKDSSPVHT